MASRVSSRMLLQEGFNKPHAIRLSDSRIVNKTTWRALNFYQHFDTMRYMTP